MNNESENNPEALQRVLHYHENTKHHVERSASGPGYLDWATQPDPFCRSRPERAHWCALEKVPTTNAPLYDDAFRRYSGARLVPLEKVAPLYDDAFAIGRIPPAPVTLRTISQLFYDSLAISAWKSTGETSWALRVNPCSGNLHPTEGYVICGPIPGLCDTPVVCHYAPKEHGLEVRATFMPGLWAALWPGAPADAFLLGLDVHPLA